MKRAIKWIAIILAILVVLALALPFLIDVNTFRPRIESELTNALGRSVTVGNLSLSLWSGSLAADNITIADDPAFSRTPFVKADALNVGVNVLPLVLSKKLEIRNITLKKPQVSLMRTPGGKWNFSTIGPADPSATPANKTASEQDLEQNFSVGELSIRDGQITVADTNAPGRARVYSNVDVTVKNFSFASQFPFTISADLAGGGKAKLDGTAGPIKRNDSSLTPLQE